MRVRVDYVVLGGKLWPCGQLCVEKAGWCLDDVVPITTGSAKGGQGRSISLSKDSFRAMSNANQLMGRADSASPLISAYQLPFETLEWRPMDVDGWCRACEARPGGRGGELSLHPADAQHA